MLKWTSIPIHLFSLPLYISIYLGQAYTHTHKVCEYSSNSKALAAGLQSQKEYTFLIWEILPTIHKTDYTNLHSYQQYECIKTSANMTGEYSNFILICIRIRLLFWTFMIIHYNLLFLLMKIACFYLNALFLLGCLLTF